jgi:hypothetical protein
VRVAVLIVLLFCAPGLAAAQDNAGTPAKRAQSASKPLPVVIPQQFAPPQETYASQPESADAATAAAPSACQIRLARIATFKPLPILVGAGECGATDAVLMDTIILPDQSKVAVTPEATMRCPMAEAIAQWIREDVAPAVKTFGAPLRVLDNFDSYECRGRNRQRAAVLSEHGRADALDVRAFKLADGQVVSLTDVTVNKDFREGIKTSVCARFMTVLGPGSDGFHEEHIHLDLAERSNNYRLCHWEVRVPPQPEAKNQNSTPSGDSAANEHAMPIPIDEVPLPRARPIAQIERALSNRAQ